MIKLRIMRNKISFLALIAIALNVNYVCASECIGEDCNFIPLVPYEITQNIDTDDMLAPIKYEINWTIPALPVLPVAQNNQTCKTDYGCPFKSDTECEIWKKKPVYMATLSPRSQQINPIRVNEMISEIYYNHEVSANDEKMFPLMERYNILMNAGNACCTSGIVYKMRQKGADDDEIYEFLKADANHFALTKRCLIMSDKDIHEKYSSIVDGKMVTAVRDACLCKNRQWFDSLLQPFSDMYERIPAFKSSAFMYKYKDGMNREISTSVNAEVQSAIETLSNCPK